jgi:membrane associated rhomboid family serine protease
MDKILARLERRLGRFAVPNLIAILVIGMGLVWVLSATRPEAMARLAFDWPMIRFGQFWRLGTFLFIPPASRSYWILVNLYFIWWIGSSLEQHWGTFRFNVYYFVGAFATIVAGILANHISNTWLDYSLMLAFATVFPNVEILLFFVIPVRVKWIGALVACFFAYELVTGDFATRAAIVAALSSYALFFAEDGLKAWRGRRVTMRQQVRRTEMKSNAPALGQRECALCGAKEIDGADIRVCVCTKCGGRARNLCLQHARNH